MLRSSGAPGSSLRLMPSSITLISAASDRYGFTAESTDRYSKRPGADTRSAVVRFWKPQSANTGAQKPVSHSRRYELTVEAVTAVSAERCSRMPPIDWMPILLGSRGSSESGMNRFSSPFQSEMLVWQPLADTPTNGFGMKH